MVRQAQKEGQAKAASPEVARVASSIKKSDAKDFASTKHKGLPEKKKMNEEGYDHYRDNILMKGGDHRSKETKNKPYTPSKPVKGKTAAQKAAKGKSALDIVKANIRKQYGKGAIMGEDVNCADRKEMAAQHKAVHNKKKDETGGYGSTVTAKNRRGQMQGVDEGKQETGRSNYGKASVRNMRAFGKGGNRDDAAERLVGINKREAEHKASRGVKGSTQKRENKMKPVKWSNKNNEDNRTEEVLHELSKKTLANYTRKSATDLAKHSIEFGSKPNPTSSKKLNKRHMGIMKAASKMSMEEEKDGLWDNIRQKKARMKAGSGEKKAKPGDKDYPKTLNVEGIMGMVKRAAGVKAKKTTGRDAGAIAAKIMRDKENKKYVNFLPANEEIDRPYTGPDKKDRAVIKKMDNKDFAKKAAEYEKNMSPEKRQALKDKATKGMKFTHEGTSYGLYKGDGKASGAMKKYLDKKAKMLTKKREAQSDAAKNNPHFDSTQPSPSGRNKYEHVSFKSYFTEGNKTARMLHKSKTQVTGNVSADRGGDEKKNKESRKGLEKDLKKKGIGYTKGVGKYKYDSGETGTEVSYQTSKPAKMSKRKFGKTMRRLGRKHGQESVVTKDKNKPARLHDTESKKPGKSMNIGKSKPGSNPSGQGETSGNKVRGKSLPKKQNKGAYHYGK
jgi:hypothetical protein